MEQHTAVWNGDYTSPNRSGPFVLLALCPTKLKRLDLRSVYERTRRRQKNLHELLGNVKVLQVQERMLESRSLAAGRGRLKSDGRSAWRCSDGTVRTTTNPIELSEPQISFEPLLLPVQSA